MQLEIKNLKVRFKINDSWSRWYSGEEILKVKGLIASAVEVQEIVTNEMAVREDLMKQYKDSLGRR